ncbi:MAG: hypothetical protein AAFU80_11045 [Pseudomonadota bacterium]
MIALITGMSGTGKSTVISELARQGHRALDLDQDGWSRWAPCEGDPTGANLAEIEPLLRQSATKEVDATEPLGAVVRSIHSSDP